MVQRKFFAVSAGALVLALIGSLGAPRSLAATAVKMERIAAVHHLHVYTVTPGYAARRRRQLTDGEEGRYGFCPRRSRCQATFSCPVAEFSASSCDLPTSACSNEYRDIPKANEIGQSLPRSADSKPGQLESMPG